MTASKAAHGPRQSGDGRSRIVPHDAACAARLKDRTLTKLYNAHPAWLADCHAHLDAAYGWPADLTDDAILERLLALNLERAKER